MERGHLLEKLNHIYLCMYIKTVISSMEVIIHYGLIWDWETWTLSYIVLTMYIPDLTSSSTISYNVTHMFVIMKIILKFVLYHIVEMIWGLIVVSSTSLCVGILKSENVVVNFYVKSSSMIKIYNFIINRLTNTFDVSIKIVLCAYPLGLLIMTWFWNIACSFIGVEFDS